MNVRQPMTGIVADTGWFEDFAVGQRMRHARASTIGEVEGAFLAKLVMNTAQPHWNEVVMAGHPLGPGRLVFGLATAATVFGLASQDTVEHAVCELRYDRVRFRSPVHHGDTIEAFSEVLECRAAPDRADAGIVRFMHWGRNQEGAVVVEAERTALIKRRSHWA
jgi:itaconyl-CoA hydratase